MRKHRPTFTTEDTETTERRFCSVFSVPSVVNPLQGLRRRIGVVSFDGAGRAIAFARAPPYCRST